MRPTARLWLCLLAAFVALTACHRDGRPEVPDLGTDPADHGSVIELGEGDTILATDLVGSVLEETSATGTKQAEFAAYPFGVARFDTSLETRKFAAVPRDGAVSLDHMGARFYAPDLGIWTSGEPLAITEPERLVCDQFAAANPYAYSNLSPTISGDRDGHFWQVLAAGFVGAAIGAGSEAVKQYLQFGKIEDVGRIEAAAAGGFISGTLAALNPAASLATVMGVGAGNNVASGVAERLVASGGKSVGTVGEIATDAAIGGLTDGLLHGAAPLIKRAVARVGETAVARTAKAGVANAEKSFFRNMSHAEAEAVQKTKVLRGGREGQTYWTDSKYQSASAAKAHLALEDHPDVQMEFKITNNPKMQLDGTLVAPKFGEPGGGREHMSLDPVEVEVINVEPHAR